MTEEADRVDPLIEDLRALFTKDDPVPPLVVETARASLGWRRLEADLAELLSDSAIEAGEPALARGGTAQIRSVSFAAGGLTIDVEIQGGAGLPGGVGLGGGLGPGGDAGLRILGQLSPPAVATVELQSAGADGAPVTVVTDALGRFQAPLAARGAVRLRIGIGDRATLGGVSYVETSWIPL